MFNLGQIEEALAQFEAQITEAIDQAKKRLGRKPKLGELKLPADLYQEMLSVLRQVYRYSPIRRVFFSADKNGRRSRLILLTFMSELIYWEYESSFWRVTYDSFEVDGTSGDYSWFTSQMVRGYDEQGIPLIETYQGRQYVRTIVLQSGFSRQTVQDMRKFILWYFEHNPDLDPRQLDTSIFESMLEEYDLVGKDEMVDLLREMIWDVSRLLRVIHKKSLISTDLRDPEVLEKLAEELGFHPIKDIFGFRDDEDIQELLETLSARINPKRLYSYLVKRAAGRQGDLRITLPSGETVNEISPEKIPLQYGFYRLEPGIGNVYVVPKESITYSRFEEMIRRSPRSFHRDGPSFAFIHDKQSFTVLSGTQPEPPPYPYCVDGQKGFFWYGRQRIGIPLSAHQADKVFDQLDPYLSTTLSPWLRLNHERTGLEVVIPSFTCYIPDHGGATCRLEVNRQPVSDELYLIDQNGFLQLQGSRTFPFTAKSQDIDVFLQRLDDGTMLATARIDWLLQEALLFNGKTRGIIQPGQKHQGENELYLLLQKRGDYSVEPDVEIKEIARSGDFHIYRLNWHFEQSSSLKLEAGSSKWEFQKAFRIDLLVDARSSHPKIKPLDDNSAFSSSDVHIKLVLSGDEDEIEIALKDLTLIVDKDDEFISDFGLLELEKNHWLDDLGTASDAYQILTDELIAGLIEANLMDTAVGSWKLSVSRRTPGTRDIEIFDQASFLILPKIKVQAPDELVIEGKETFLTVHCDNPFLADYEERPSSVVQVPYIPELNLSLGDEQLKVRQTEKNIRLYYPPTRVKVTHKPQKVFGIRILEKKVLPGIDKFVVNARFLKTSRLYARGDPGEEIFLQTGSDGIKYRLNENGNLKIPLSILSDGVREHIWHLSVEHNNHRKHFTVEWSPEFKFKPRGCQWESGSSGTGRLELAFEIDGPPDEMILIQVLDGRGRLLHKQEFTSANLASGSLSLDLETPTHPIHDLYCTALYEGKPLDIVSIHAEESVSDLESVLKANLQTQMEYLFEKTHEELFNLFMIVDLLGLSQLRKPILKEMFSIRSLDQIYEAIKSKSIGEDYLRNYFQYYKYEAITDIQRMPIPKLKKYCIMPCPSMVAACSQALLINNDGVGVDHVIEDLLLPGHISFDEGIEILKSNEECSAEILRDIIDLDALEKADEAHIDLLFRLCEFFHPAAKRKARAVKDWKRAYDTMQAKQVTFYEVIDWTSQGLRVAFGVLLGVVPFKEFDGTSHGLGKSDESILRRIPKMLGKKIPLVVTRVERKYGTLILSEKMARNKSITQFMKEVRVDEKRTGIITGITELGIFVDLGGVTGLVHDSTLRSKEKYKHLKWGDQVRVRITKIDKERKRIGLKIV